jgi:hypothetical protein
MKRLVSSITFVAFAHLAITGCDNSNGGGSAGSGGSGGSGSGGNASSSSSSSTTSSSSSTTSSSSSSSGALGPGDCRTSADCDPNGGTCYSPGAPTPCGICYEPPVPCMNDTECAMQDPTTICNPPQCSCGGSECMPGCMSDGDCKAWEYCSPGHRCLPDTCSSNADCPTNFECATMACARKSCTSDADCNGLCVNSECHDMAGHCMLPPP